MTIHMNYISKMEKSITNVKYIGPGVWTTIHLLAANIESSVDRKMFEGFMEGLRAKFPCEKCRTHMNEYMKAYPVGKTFRSSNLESTFEWTVDFHNAVNRRLRKPAMSMDEARSLYIGEDSVCTTGHCADDGHDEISILSNPRKSRKTFTIR